VEDAVEASERPPDTPPARLLGVAQQLRAETRKLTERGGQFVQENKALVALGAAGLVGSAVGFLVAGGAIMATRLSRSQDEETETGSSRDVSLDD